MSDCLCDICKKRIAIIQIEGQGQYCLECHNNRQLDGMGRDNSFQYAQHISIMEPNGNMHTFKVEHMILGGAVSWEAYEIGGDYHFRYISDISMDGAAAANQFFRKIANGVCTKTLEEMPFTAELPGYRSQSSTSLREKGNIYIIDDEDEYGKAAFIIDGKKYTADELAELLSPYSEFMIRYQIHDESENLLGEDEYLMPVHITKSSLINELIAALDVHGNRGFLSYKHVFAFDDVFYKTTDKLETLYRSRKKDDAISAGIEMVKILAHTGTDDDMFPSSEIQLICCIVDPFGINEELKAVVREWKESYE